MKKIKQIKRSIILTLFLVFLFSCSQNEEMDFKDSNNLIEENLAITIANNVLFRNNSNKSDEVKNKVKEISPIKDEKNKTIFYIINYENKGFLILSADNRISPILAYSETNAFRTNAESYPSGLVEWLSSTKETIQSVRKKNLKQTKELESEWDSFLSQRYPLEQFNTNDCDDETEIVNPLLTTEWNQNCGYNTLMPTLNCTVPCGRAFAGCVPVAIAQVMRYHNHPTNYNWANMPNNFGTTETALLISDIHNTISDVSYNCDGTGVDKDYNTAGLFTSHYNYSTANQTGYNREAVKQNLRQNKPVILGGGRNDGWWIFNDYTDGHMWVCDGFMRIKSCYNDGTSGSITYLLFHMNWGWGGFENGWYAFNNFNPNNNTFNYQVKMIHNINP